MKKRKHIATVILILDKEATVRGAERAVKHHKTIYSPKKLKLRILNTLSSKIKHFREKLKEQAPQVPPDAPD